MKIAKKVLAVVMAIAMIGCLTAMAFAADGAKIVFNVNEPDAKGIVYVDVNFVNCEGLKSFDLVVSDFAFTAVKDGDDIAAAGQADNALTYDKNPAEGKISGYFKNVLYTTAEWADAADANLADATVSDGANFKAFKIAFKTGDVAEAIAKISGTVAFEGKDNLEIKDEQIVLKAAAPATEATEATQATEATEATEKGTDATVVTEEKPTDNANPNDDVKTGDTMALAAAAGVVALAGAAFIISKKRK